MFIIDISSCIICCIFSLYNIEVEVDLFIFTIQARILKLSGYLNKIPKVRLGKYMQHDIVIIYNGKSRSQTNESIPHS